ncbi:MAG: ABC transporter permease [Lachnospiraceae bacterium]|nr:ABC transporter permease [Lachnospiraceae bacterium]
MRKKNVFNHAFSMVLKNKRAYALLSVTIVMSFTFLLSFLIYTDSKVISENTEVIMQEPYLFETILTDVDANTRYTYISNLNGVDNTQYYMTEDVLLGDSHSDIFNIPLAVQGNAWGMHLRYQYEIVMENGDQIELSGNQGVVEQGLYKQLQRNSKGKEIVVKIPIQLKNGNIKYIDINVIGGFKIKNSMEKEALGANNLIISHDAIKELDYETSNTRMYIYTEYPSKVQEISENLSLFTKSIYKDRYEKYPKIEEQLRNKALIAVLLFILLGINLYSSFNNALNERKFEIGVKRAIGASSKDIILQFLCEGIIVVFTNILISSMLSVFIFIGYKWYMNVVKNTVYIFTVSVHSIGMYLVASIFLTVAFSLLFAVQSAQVEIIKYIKGE